MSQKVPKPHLVPITVNGNKGNDHEICFRSTTLFLAKTGR
ncbi:Uncharacterised protein [Vibrio cholerae]|nr:Uncharacterised protein [Vibrio cholerae]CSI46332.1 Uncharacterised protein [Vibrio cholerae]